MPVPVFKVLSPGFSATLQDQGRAGWKRFGVPMSGAMDDHAASVGNRLLGNTPWAPVIELALHGAKFEVLRDTWAVLTGADAGSLCPRWRTIRLTKGDILHFPHILTGVWSYLAIEDGFHTPLWLDSGSTWEAAGFGRALREGDVLEKSDGPGFHLPRGIAARRATSEDERSYESTPPLRIYPGPQWSLFSPACREAFLSRSWRISSKSNRVGWRLDGEPLAVDPVKMISEPTPLGSIQVPPDGLPIVLMRDGPVVGGYPKIGILAAEDLSWLSQGQPGSDVRFVLATPEPTPLQPAA